MIYELRTTQLHSGKVAEYERRLEAALAERRSGDGRLAGAWHTEIGPLNQVLELWSYADGLEPTGGLGVLGDSSLVLSTAVERLEPAPFSPTPDGTEHKIGPIYELRIYQIRAGDMQSMIDIWAPKIPERIKLSPMVGCWYTAFSRWLHLWAYPDLNTRTNTRAEAVRRGIWPPPSGALTILQENRILLPASFSPLQ